MIEKFEAFEVINAMLDIVIHAAESTAAQCGGPDRYQWNHFIGTLRESKEKIVAPAKAA